MTLMTALLAAVAPCVGASQDEPDVGSLEPGLRSFLAARVLESEGRYHLAMEEYARSLEENPGVVETRIRYASLLTDMGLAERALSLLEGRGDLDWYGQRILALALSRAATQQPDLLGRAEDALRKVLEERPDDPTIQLNLGQVVHREGRVAEAEAIIADLREHHGGNPQLILYHASLLRSLGRQEEASELYRGCVDGVATAVPCREGLIETLQELGRPAAAGEAILGWASDDDLDQLLRAAALLADGGRSEEGLQVVRRVLAREPSSPPAQTMEARLLVRLGRHDEAARRLEELLSKDRDNLGLTLTLAWVRAQTGQAEAARRLIERAWALAGEETSSEEGVRVVLSAARTELLLDSPSRAREWLDRLEDPRQGGTELVRLLAECYRRTEDFSDGVAAMLRLQPRLEDRARAEAMVFEAEFRIRDGDERRGLLRLQPLLASASVDDVLMAVQVLQGLERWEDVVEATGDALLRFPENRGLRFARAAALERLSRLDEAAGILQALVDESPRDAASANYLGYMWADAGIRLDEARRLIGVAVEIEPDNPAYQDSMGWVNFRLGNLAQAEEWLRRALEGSRGDGTVLSHLGQVLLARGDSEEGVRLLRRALELGCDDPDRVRELLDAAQAQ